MKKSVFALLLVLAFAPRPAAALETDDLLSLVAMPLAVAAVSEVTDVPAAELIDIVSLLNDAAVPPPQFIEVVRYVPVALVVENDEPNFVEFVRTRTQSGIRGDTLVTIIEDRYRTVYGLPEVQLVSPPQVVVRDDFDRDFVPVVVHTRIAEVKRHPHGGPPGQVKKQLGLQTGAEVVQRSRPATTRVVRDDDGDERRRARVARSVKVKEGKPAKIAKPDKHQGGGPGKVKHHGGQGKVKHHGGGDNRGGGGGNKGEGKGKKGKG